jgi:hypothetical protein
MLRFVAGEQEAWRDLSVSTDHDDVVTSESAFVSPRWCEQSCHLLSPISTPGLPIGRRAG